MNKTELTEAAGVQPVVFCCHAYEKKVQWTFFELSVQYLYRYDSQTHENRLRRSGLFTFCKTKNQENTGLLDRFCAMMYRMNASCLHCLLLCI